MQSFCRDTIYLIWLKRKKPSDIPFWCAIYSHKPWVILNQRWYNCIFRSPRPIIKQLRQLDWFLLCWEVICNGEGWQLSFLLLHLVVGGHLIRRRHRQILQSGFKVLCELAPGCHSTRATDILKGPDNYLLWGTFLCIVGYFAALLASTH